MILSLFMLDLEKNLPKPIQNKLNQFHFDRIPFNKLIEKWIKDKDSFNPTINKNRIQIANPSLFKKTESISEDEKNNLDKIGRLAISNKEVAVAILAGGMATRFGGDIKALVPLYQELSFLDIRLIQLNQLANKLKTTIPVFIMLSFQTEKTINEHILKSASKYPNLDIKTFTQFLSLRFNFDGSIYQDHSNQVSLHATGHGDFSFALKESGLLEHFIKGGGKTIMLTNIDNIGASLNPTLIGLHLENKKEMSVEVVLKKENDKGGAPALVDGHLEIIESFRFDPNFNQDQIPVFNTNTLYFDASSLLNNFNLTFFAVEKKVEQQPVMQFERLVGEISAFLSTSYFIVPRDGERSRFFPIKHKEDLLEKEKIKTILQEQAIL